MLKGLWVTCLSLLLTGMGGCGAPGKDSPMSYFVSSSLGSDQNDGTSPEKAWATLERVNNAALAPGQRILFKAGDLWEGQLELGVSGTTVAPILVDRYGTGSRPRIDGRGEKPYTLRLRNVSYVTVRNLEITNLGPEREARRTGVLMEAMDIGECRGITLDSLEVHHVNGSLAKAEGGGSAITWRNGGDSLPSRFHGLIIQNSYLHHTERNGIISRGYARRNEWYPSLGVIIRNNLLEAIPGDGIVPVGTDGALIEYNTMRDSPDILPDGEAAAGIWPWSADHTVIQYNEVSGHKAPWDGQGFDADYNCNNTLIQFNYSHDNYGGFLLVCNNGGSLGEAYNHGTLNARIRYNLSINDGVRPYPTKRRGWFSPIIHITGPVKEAMIEKNIIIREETGRPTPYRPIISVGNWGDQWPEQARFQNNFLLLEDPGSPFLEGPDILQMQDNRILRNSRLIHDIKEDLERQGNRITPEWIVGWLDRARE